MVSRARSLTLAVVAALTMAGGLASSAAPAVAAPAPAVAPTTLPAESGPHAKVSVYWWGVNGWMDHGLTQALVTTFRAGSSLEDTVGILIANDIPEHAARAIAQTLRDLAGVADVLETNDHGAGVTTRLPWFGSPTVSSR